MKTTVKPRTIRVQAPILLDALEEPSGDGMSRIRIPTIRRAEFVAGRYGPLKFDDDFIGSIIRNFQANVLGVEVSIDASHRPELGALGWAEHLEYQDGSLVTQASATPEGARLVREKTYRYASAEIDPNYIDRETGEEFGPTLLGIALTNRPYVHRQGEVTLLSLDDNYRVMESGQDDVEEEVLAFDWSDAARKAASKARELNKVQTGKLTTAVRKAIQNARRDTSHFKGRLAVGKTAVLRVLGRTGLKVDTPPPSLRLPSKSQRVGPATPVANAALTGIKKAKYGLGPAPSTSIRSGSFRSTQTSNVGSAALRAVGKAKAKMPARKARPAPIRKALKRQFEPIKVK